MSDFIGRPESGVWRLAGGEMDQRRPFLLRVAQRIVTGLAMKATRWRARISVKSAVMFSAVGAGRVE